MTLEVFAKKNGFGYMNQPISQDLNIPKSTVSLFPVSIAQKYNILPWQVSTSEGITTLSILTCNQDIFSLQDDLLNLARETNPNIDALSYFMIEEKYLQDAISDIYGVAFDDSAYSNDTFEVVTEANDDSDFDEVQDELVENSPIVTMVNTIIKTAVEKKASDIHFEPEDSGMIVKFRLDGVLIPQNQYMIQEKNKRTVVARLKMLAQMDVSKKRDTQDGNMKLRINDNEVDFRVSSLPVINGEKIVLRILDKTTSLLSLDKLGFTKKDIHIVTNIINRPTGMILITGPTGSGKSTTLYSMLNEIDSVSKNITTIENPVEYQLRGINQVQVDDKHMTFASALREILRQDPDVVMVGEIRDKETAENAVQAAQTGHLVFSTLHTNDAISVISRLKRFDVEPDAITQTLLCVMAQRLVRNVCPHCQEEYVPDFEKYGLSEEDVAALMQPNENEAANGLVQHHFVHGVGCEKCNQTGYKGRRTIYEYYTLDDDIRDMIERGETVYNIKKFLSRDRGYKTMWENAINLVRNNTTTIEEVISKVKR